MITVNQNIYNNISEFIKRYVEMDIKGLTVHCPYWMNKLKEGRVVLRGFANGKGGAREIRKELIKRFSILSQEKKIDITRENIRKFARRERIGIDCSGFVYRLLDQLIQLNYQNCNLISLTDIFTKGINRTNVRMLTSSKYCMQVGKIRDFRLGDIIRLWGGKHIAIIIHADEKEILYAHSSSLSTEIAGVHTSIIHIINADETLMEQVWEEKTRFGENFGKKRFDSGKGDGVFRLKIFEHH